jgi:hypothetical protein
MKLKVDISGGVSSSGLAIEPGESIEIPLTWKNEDGTERSVSGNSNTFNLYRVKSGVRTLVASVPQSTTATLVVPASITATWALGTYHGELLESAPTGVVSIGSFGVAVVP